MNTPCLRVPLPVSMPGRNYLPKSCLLLLSLLQLPVTCILCFKAVNLFIFFARHTAFNLWWRNWSRRQNVPILWLHKAELFLYNVCMKMRCLLAVEAFISSFCGRKKRGKTVVYCKLQRLRLHKKSTAVLIALFIFPFIVFKDCSLHRLFI